MPKHEKPAKKTVKAKKKAKAPAKKTAASKKKTGTSERKSNQHQPSQSLLDQIVDFTGQMTSSAIDIARAGKSIPLMFTDSWLKDAYIKTVDPERLEAMADAGRFLQDAREVAGLNLLELAEAIGLSDTELLEEVEEGRATLPFDMILRIASLIARHDPIPFILKFVRTYNPELEQRLEAWGILSLPRQYERERRYVNLFRKHDGFRQMSDEQFDHFITYMEGATTFTLSIMEQALPAKDDDGED